ncbi:MAG: LTA synthase family protein [Planctomycetota bacterium]
MSEDPALPETAAAPPPPDPGGPAEGAGGPTLSELLSWREGAARVAAAARARPSLGLAWLLPALIVLVQQQTRLLGRAGQGNGALGALLLLLGGGALTVGAARCPEADPRGVSRRAWLAGCVLVVAWVLLAAAPPLTPLAEQRPGRWLAVGALALASAAAFLLEELRRLWRAQSEQAAAAVWVLGLVAGAVCLGEATARLGVTQQGITAAALGLNLAALTSCCALLLALSRRPWFSLAIPLLLYLSLHVANGFKLHFLHAPLSPFDLQYVSDFTQMEVVRPWHVGLAAAAFLALGVGLLRTWAMPLRRRTRLLLGGLALALLLGLASAYSVDPGRALLGRLGIFPRTLDARRSALSNGLLVELLCEAHALHMPAPPGYSPEAVAQALETYTAPAPPPGPRAVRLIFWFMEAFTDPRGLGFELGADPIPVFHGLQERFGRVEVVTPVFGGMSANAEFELLSGLNMAFLPRDSCPYRQYVRRPLPALPAWLAGRGYRTWAFHAESLDYYDYARVYPLLGIQEAVSLAGRPGVELDASGRRASDAALARELMARVDAAPGPWFAFAFPNGTHWPWGESFVRRYGIEVRTPLTPEDRESVAGYVNALRAADEALGLLVAHYAARPEPTVILALGDHLPALSARAYAAAGLSMSWSVSGGRLDLEGDRGALRRCFTVPAVIWSNFDRPRRDRRVGMSFLGALALQESGLDLRGGPALGAALLARLPVLGRFAEGPDGQVHLPDQLPLPLARVVADYRLLQYDLLFGAGHAELSARRPR